MVNFYVWENLNFFFFIMYSLSFLCVYKIYIAGKLTYVLVSVQVKSFRQPLLHIFNNT